MYENKEVIKEVEEIVKLSKVKGGIEYQVL